MTISRMSKLGILIGTWNTVGEALETDDAPATTLYATDTYRWLPGNFFIVHDVDARFGSEPTRSMEVIGYDFKSKRYRSRSYDDKGSSEEFEVKLKGKMWSIMGDVVRFSGSFNTQKSKLTGLWELKSKKVGWQPWINLTLVRA